MGEVVIALILFAVALQYEHWLYLVMLAIASVFLAADLFQYRRHNSNISSESIEVNDIGLRFVSQYHDGIVVPWQDLVVREREFDERHLSALVLNIGPGSTAIRVEGYMELQDLDETIGSRTRHDA